MASKIIKICDRCRKETTYISELNAIEEGWTVLDINFGEMSNGLNNIRLSMDLCPKCAEELYMIKMKEYKGKTYVSRPSFYKRDELKENANDIINGTKKFLRETGEEAGWCK